MKYKTVSTLSLLVSALFSSPSWSQESQTILDKNGRPIFQIKIFETTDGPYTLSWQDKSPTPSTWNLSVDEKNRVFSAAAYWAELIQVVPGQNPAVINVGTYDDEGASAFSPVVTNTADAGTQVHAAITNQPIDDLSLQAHGFIDVGKMAWSETAFTPSQVVLTPEVDMTTVVIHEVAHALGISSEVKTYNFIDPEKTKQLVLMPETLSVWENHLYDDNHQVAQPGQVVYCSACENVQTDDDGKELTPEDIFDVRQDKAYFSGKHVQEVMAGAMPGVPLTLYGAPDKFDEPVWSHLELKNSLMSHQNYRNYTNLMEAEVAVLQDIGYTIDRKNFWGHSVYADHQQLVNDNPFFARNQDGTAYLANTYNTATLGLGLHVYGSYNDIVQRADLLSAGAGGGGIRVDGEGNQLTILAGTRVHANGTNGRGVMFTYGKDHTFTHRGDVEALGAKGIAASFDFGHNALGDNTEYRGSYIREHAFTQIPMLSELMGPLVKKADITGRLAGTDASIYISENAYVDTINIMGNAQLSGNIVSQYNQVDDDNKPRLTALTFGLKADENGQSTNQADTAFRFSYDDNIVGLNNLSLQLAGGTTQFSGHHAIYEAHVASGANLISSSTYQINPDGAFINEGKVAPTTIDSVITIDGAYKQTATGQLQLTVNDQQKFNQVVVNGAADIDGALTVAVSPGFYENDFTVTSDKWLQADTVTGSFSMLNTTLASPTLNALASTSTENTYSVSVTRNQEAYSQYGTNVNSRNVGLALSSAVSNASIQTQTLISALDFSNPDGSTVRHALPQLTGEAYASTSGALMNASHLTRSAAWGRLQQAFEGVPTGSPIRVASTDRAQSATQTNPNSAVWGYGFGTWSHQKASDSTAKLDARTGGFFTGFDTVVDGAWRLGAMAGYSQSTFKVRELGSSGDSDNYTIGTYAGREWPLESGDVAFKSGLAYTWHHLKMKRDIHFSGYQDSLSSKYNAGTFQLFGELGYKASLTERVSAEPYVNLAYVNVSTDKLKEKGNSGAALSVRTDTMNTLFSTLGVRVATQFDLGKISATAGADIGWRHAYGTTTPHSTANLVGSNAFTTTGSPIGKNAAVLETNLGFNIAKHTTVGLAYQGQFGSGLKQNAFNVNMNARF